MDSLSIDEFVERLENSRALDADRIEEIRTEVAPVRHEVDTECIARKLVKEGTLTQWQSDQLFVGRKKFVLGEYRLLDLAGRGGMGAVFKAEHIRLGRVVALKTLAPELVNRPAQVARFQNEIQAASALESPHVVRALDAAQIGKTYVLVMEFVEGESLSRLAKSRGRLPIGEACEYIRQAALGLQHAHEKGMVHRDIKPGNLILTWRPDGSPLVKVFDLGLARFVSERVDRSEMTRTGQVMGTPDYMSPEQGWDTRTVDIRGDVYSLGCSAFRLLTGRVPFRGDNPLQTLMVRCSTDAPPIGRFLPEVSEPLEALIAKMLARDPAERFQTPGELAKALAPFCEVVPREEFVRRAKKPLKPVALPAGVTAGPEGDSDTGYGKFLSTTSTGSSADILSSDAASAETLPDAGATPLDFPQLGETPAVSSSTRPASRKSGLDRRVLAGAGIAVCCLLGGVFWALQGDDSSGDSTAGATATTPTQLPQLKFLPVPETAVDEGKPLQLTLRLEAENATATPSPSVLRASEPDVSFRLAGSPPSALTLDAKIGELNWQPTEADGPGRFEIAVEAIRSGEQKPAARQTVVIMVNELDAPPQVTPVVPQTVVVGERLQLKIDATDSDLPASPLRFQLAPGAPQGALINRQSGEFEWTPPASSSPGPQTVLVLVSTQSNPKTHTAQAIRINVLPARPQLKLAELPELKVAPGATLRETLRATGVPNGTKLEFEFLTPPPDGATLDPQSGEFSWKTPESLAAGKFEIGIRVGVAEDSERVATGKLVVIVAAAGTPGTNPGTVGSVQPTGPSEKEIAEAEQQARELFRREIMTARSVSERVDLAARMLRRAKEAGETSLALGLLHLAREYALKGRSVAIALEAVRIGSRRFGEDLVLQTTECLAAFRPRGSTWFDEQQVVEVGLAAALTAVEAGRFMESEKLIAVPETVLRRSKRFDEADRLNASLDFLKTIRAEVPDEKKLTAKTLSESTKLARAELIESLQSLQFQPVFPSKGDVSFFRHTDRDLPDLGQSLWKIESGSASLDVPKQPVNSGFVDRTHTLTSFTLRMNISTDTTAGMLCIGVPQSGSFNGLRLHLGASQFCFLRKATGTESLARPTSPVPRSRGGQDQIELRVRSGHLTALVNNAVVIDTSVDAETSGFLGLDAYLGNASPARIRLENVRVRAE